MGIEKIPEEILGLTEKVYEDVASKPLNIVSNSMSDLIKFVTLPFSFLGLTSDKLLVKYKMFLDESVKKVPEEKRVYPEPLVVSKLFDDVKFVFEDKILSDMFSNLLASSINKDTYENIHISFVNIISQLDTLDALLFKEVHDSKIFPICDVFFTDGNIGEKLFSNLCTLDKYSPMKLSVSVVNLTRLGLIEITEDNNMADSYFTEIQSTKEYKRIIKIYDNVKDKKDAYRNFSVRLSKRKISFTTLGEIFSNYVL